MGQSAPVIPAPQPVPAEALELRAVRPDDAAALHALLARALPDTPPDFNRWRRLWTWRCWDNPYREKRDGGWVLVQDGRIEGHVGAVHLPLWVNGRPEVGMIVSDYCLAGQAAAQGGMFLGLRLAQAFFEAATATGCLPLATTANDKTGAVFARFGCRPVVWTREYWLVSADLRSEIRACRGGSSRIVRRLQRARIAPVFNRVTQRLYACLRRRPAIPLPAGCGLLEESMRCSGLVDSLGHLDDECCRRRLAVRRDVEYLTWRHVRHPESDSTRVFMIRRHGGNLLGAAIVSLDVRAGCRRALVEELIAPAERGDVLKALLCAALRFARDGGADYLVSVTGRWSDRPLYWELGFHSGARSAPAVVIPKSVWAQPAEATSLTPPEDVIELWHGAMF